MNKGRVVIDGSVDDQPFTVAFKDMEVELQILSVRKMVRRRNHVDFRDGGGTIRNLDTGKVLHFHEHDGVYFIKMKTSGPNDDVEHAGFHRQGTK